MESRTMVLEGELDFNVPLANKPCTTWYTIFGDLKSGSRPLVCLQGGPGMPHNYMRPLKNIAISHGVPIIMYDQLGSGKSTYLPEKAGDGEFRTVDLFLSELENLLSKLGIQDDYDLLGQSWGGMLAASHAIRQPQGLHRLILADTLTSMDSWVDAVNGLVDELPDNIKETIKNDQKGKTTDPEEFQAAMQVFYEKHFCRVKPFPDDLNHCFAAVVADPTVYFTMCVPLPTPCLIQVLTSVRHGTSEFLVIGTLQGWTIEAELRKINVPTLLINCEYDPATDKVMKPFFKAIGKVKWVRLKESSHMPQFEQLEEFLEAVTSFIRSV
ncbi:L-amino acid amidase [Lachnellula suecica]|uniref:L-amino acid amidase n=1 Tax=Lachnellula suecica TaxID=602035 RepID=A0A8T9C171_9HELO|nr:L-amino acid amidase [Lachnellula suecica]